MELECFVIVFHQLCGDKMQSSGELDRKDITSYLGFVYSCVVATVSAQRGVPKATLNYLA